MTQDEFEVTVEFVKSETAKAYLLVVDGCEYWVAKSQLIDDQGLDPGDEDVSIVVPMWLAEENGWA